MSTECFFFLRSSWSKNCYQSTLIHIVQYLNEFTFTHWNGTMSSKLIWSKDIEHVKTSSSLKFLNLFFNIHDFQNTQTKTTTKMVPIKICWFRNHVNNPMTKRFQHSSQTENQFYSHNCFAKKKTIVFTLCWTIGYRNWIPLVNMWIYMKYRALLTSLSM